MAREPIETLQALVSPAAAQAPHKRSDLHWDHGCWGRILHFPHLKGNYTSIYVLIYIYIYIIIYIWMGLNLIYKTIQYSKSTDSQKCLWQSTGIAAIMDLLQYDQLDSTRNPGNSCSKWPFHWSYNDNLWKLWGCYYVTLKFQTDPYQMFHRSQETWSCRTRFFNSLQSMAISGS